MLPFRVTRRTRTRVVLTALFATLGLLLPAAMVSADPIPLPPRPPFPSLSPLPPGAPLPPNPGVPRPPTLPQCPPTCISLGPEPYDAVVYGDSYTSGEGASHNHRYVTKADGTEDFRHQSGLAPFSVAWAALEMGRHPSRSMNLTSETMQSVVTRDRLFFNASSGAWINHLDEQQKECRTCSAIRNQPQAQDVPTMAKIAYFGLGGNDAGFADLVSTAVEAYMNPRTGGFRVQAWQQDQEQAVAAEMGRLQPRIDGLKDKVADGLFSVRETHPVAEIVVALYPLAVKQSGNTGIREVTGRSMDLMYPFAVKVNQAIRDGVALFESRYPGTKVHVFDPNTAGPNGTSVIAGHELGQPNSYVHGLVYRNDIFFQGQFFKSFQESFHPNELGSVAIGRALATFMAGKFPSLFPSGPNFDKVTVNAQPLATSEEEANAALQYAATNPTDVCEETEIDSVCRFITPTGIVIQHDLWFNPNWRSPTGGNPVPGGSDQGSPGGGGDGGSTWIPVNYIPKDPCDIFYPTFAQYYAGVQIQGGPLHIPMRIDELLLVPTRPKCIPGIGLVYE
ncbi:hypothetical protein AB0J90_18175 [Micromonospora sp. NPDC049523]|uniref:hypothetical protein n=1 Tax=Micromonospora sp. NPDC049523 TaxID=3155921 RepID=UPI00342B9CBE